MPLLPLFLYQVPKVGEYVHVVYYNTELQDRNKFYIQGNFSSPNNTKFEPYDSSLAFMEKVKEIHYQIILEQTMVNILMLTK